MPDYTDQLIAQARQQALQNAGRAEQMQGYQSGNVPIPWGPLPWWLGGATGTTGTTAGTTAATAGTPSQYGGFTAYNPYQRTLGSGYQITNEGVLSNLRNFLQTPPLQFGSGETQQPYSRELALQRAGITTSPEGGYYLPRSMVAYSGTPAPAGLQAYMSPQQYQALLGGPGGATTTPTVDPARQQALQNYRYSLHSPQGLTEQQIRPSFQPTY